MGSHLNTSSRKYKSPFVRSSTYALIFVFLATLSLVSRSDVSGEVVSVTDGDTIKVLDNKNQEYKIRLTGIDAPEKKQPLSVASKKHLASIIGGKQVFVESSETDRYGRILGKVILDGMDVNLEQVKAGYAWWYRYYAKTQSVEDQSKYEAAELSAQEEQQGLWSDPHAINPYDWRKGKRQ